MGQILRVTDTSHFAGVGDADVSAVLQLLL